MRNTAKKIGAKIEKGNCNIKCSAELTKKLQNAKKQITPHPASDPGQAEGPHPHWLPPGQAAGEITPGLVDPSLAFMCVDVITCLLHCLG